LAFTKFLKKYWLLFVVAATIVILDQISKAYIRANFIEGVDMWAPWDWMLPYARIVYVSNTGVAFGMFQGLNIPFAILAVIVTAAIIYYYPQVPVEDWPLRLAMGFQMGGALGNLIDRITMGHVTDFISVGNFPVFNVADSGITIGVGILLLGVWLQERRQKKEQSARVDQVIQPSSPVDTDQSTQDGSSS